jgi:hypothetical protein
MKQKNKHNVREREREWGIGRDQDTEEERYGKKIRRKTDRMRGTTTGGI